MKKLRLVVAFRYDPPWNKTTPLDTIKDSIRSLFSGPRDPQETSKRIEEYGRYVDKFRGEIDGKIARLADLGLHPSRVDGQGLIDLLYPILNRRSTKGGKFKRGRYNAVPVPVYDPDDLLANQISDTPAKHPEDGYLQKDGRVYHTVSMVKPPKQCLPLMTVSLQSVPYESILTITYSRDAREKQLKRLDSLDSTLGMRERSAQGRANQKVLHQIQTIRQAREELYSNRSQLVRVGMHHVQITQNLDEARRASSEVLALFPALNGARGMSHMISDLGVLVNALPGAYEPSTDGAGWTCTLRSSRAVRMFPLWGNWAGGKNALFVLPSLWNPRAGRFRSLRLKHRTERDHQWSVGSRKKLPALLPDHYPWSRTLFRENRRHTRRTATDYIYFRQRNAESALWFRKNSQTVWWSHLSSDSISCTSDELPRSNRETRSR